MGCQCIDCCLLINLYIEMARLKLLILKKVYVYLLYHKDQHFYEELYLLYHILIIFYIRD